MSGRCYALPTDATRDAPPAAWCIGVVKVYQGPAGEVSALKGVDVELPASAVTALVGPSGSGKSSLLRILAGFDRPTAGSVVIGGVETNGLRPSALRSLRRGTIGYVFQRPADNLISYLTVLQHLRQAARLGGRASGWADRADELLAVMDLAHRADHRPAELSGGEQQRASFAAALMTRPALVVADEPTGELDSGSAHDLLACVAGAARDGTAFAVATHDPVVVADATRTYHLRHGSIEAEARDDRRLSVIDEAGRIQLPADWRRLFPRGRAEIQEEDDHMRIVPP
jgi:putative ABC transport system ATP-binding protein